MDGFIDSSAAEGLNDLYAPLPREEGSGERSLATLRDRGVDPQLFQREVLRHREELVAAGTRLSGSRAEAEDLVQEAILRAWTFFERFEPGTNGRAWMHRILFNTFVNGWRRRRREREILTEVHAVSTHAEANRQSRPLAPGETLSDEVQAALDRLPADFRRVIVLVDIEEKSYRDAAVAIGCPIGTVMSRLHRARRAMQIELTEYAAHEGWSPAPASRMDLAEAA